MTLPQTHEFEHLITSDVPLLDVRAPCEFAQGAFPCSQNAPLLNDQERKQIGLCYKHEGREAAVALGTKLIAGEVKQARLLPWLEFVEQHPDGVLYCFRGGMRSQITQQWIYEASGIVVPRIKGGYKALRRFLIDQTDLLANQIEALILSGRTGSGKTHVIKQLSHSIDLEKLANHRGSSFGKQLLPQPSQIEFENKIATELIKLHYQGVTKIVFEDESPNIGSVHIPHTLYHKMRASPCVVLDEPMSFRVEITLQEYVVEMLDQYIEQAGDENKGFALFADYLRISLFRVRRRLGHEGYRQILALMERALADQKKTTRANGHCSWLSSMLSDYYDPMYDYQLKKRDRTVLYTANTQGILDYLHAYQ